MFVAMPYTKKSNGSSTQHQDKPQSLGNKLE